MKIIFMGTPDFSAEVLGRLNADYPVSAVVTGLDKPCGRGLKSACSPAKIRALELGIPVLQYRKVSLDGLCELAALEPDLIVTAAFGQILSEKLLAIPRFGVLNVHASLLPRHRGASPIQWAILCGDTETGITIMRTVREVDAGDILLSRRTPVGERETAGELFSRLARLGGEAIVEAVGLVERGEAVYTPQNDAEATRCGIITKDFGRLDFTRTARELDRFVRAMTPWPSAYTFIEGRRLKILSLAPAEAASCGAPGQVLEADAKNGLVVACGDGAVRLERVQPEGKRPMSDSEFLRGRRIAAGIVL